MKCNKFKLIVLVILINNIACADPELVPVVQQTMFTSSTLIPLNIINHHNIMSKTSTDIKCSNNHNGSILKINNKNNGTINKINLVNLSNIASNNSKVKEQSDEDEDSGFNGLIEEEKLDKYDKIAIKKYFLDKYYNGISYSDVYKKFDGTITLTKGQLKALDQVHECAKELRATINPDMELLREHLKQIENTAMFKLLISSVKNNIKSLFVNGLHGNAGVDFKDVIEKVEFKNILEEMKTKLSNPNKCKILIAFAISKILDNSKYYLNVKPHSHCPCLVFYNNKFYAVRATYDYSGGVLLQVEEEYKIYLDKEKMMLIA
ncbi:MAG: hypothetical protein IJU54_01665 [Alphaproteobacteria bacterium]|nr:hypothetical protein [Alphaproteobacteria bacterium]